MSYIISFLLLLAVGVLVHELGHFLAARVFHIPVVAFSIGFGKKVCSFKHGGIEYKLCFLPLGGYCRLADRNNQGQGSDRERFFAERPAYQRAIVFAAGPAANLLTALCLMPLAFSVGIPVPDPGLNQPPRISWVEPGSPASRAGLCKGDLILSAAGHKAASWRILKKTLLDNAGTEIELTFEREGNVSETSIVPIADPVYQGYTGMFRASPPVVGSVAISGTAFRYGIHKGDRILAIDTTRVEHWFQLVRTVHELDSREKHTILVERNGSRVEIDIPRGSLSGEGRPVLGIAPPPGTRVVRYAFPENIIPAVRRLGQICTETSVDIIGLLTGREDIRKVAGPVYLVKAGAKVKEKGPGTFLAFMAFINLQLMFVNLLPLPVLDGGQLLLLGFVSIRRKPISARTYSLMQNTSAMVLILLVVLVTINDLFAS